MQTKNIKTELDYRNDISSRAQFAIETINKYENKLYLSKMYNNMQTDPYNNVYNPQNPVNFLSQFDNRIQRILKHRALSLEKNIKIQLFPYDHQFYSLTVNEGLFPLRLIIKNVIGQIYIFVGFNKEFPGMINEGQTLTISEKQFCQPLTQKEKKLQGIKNKIKLLKGVQQEKPQENLLYHQKFHITKDIILTMKVPKKCKRPINNVYFSIVARQKLSLLNLKIDSISVHDGHQPFQRSKTEQIESQIIRSRSTKTFLKTFQGKMTMLNTKRSTSSKKLINEQGNTFFPKIMRSKTQVNEVQNSQVNQLNTLNIISQKKAKNFIKMNSTDAKKSTKFIKQDMAQKKQLFIQKQKQVQRKKQCQEVLITKNKQFIDFATKAKKLINEYQAIYMNQQNQKKMINRYLTQTIYASIFLNNLYKAYQVRQNKLKFTFKTHKLVRKFHSILRKQHTNNIIAVSNKQIRNSFGFYFGSSIVARIVNQNSKQKAGNVISSTIETLFCALSLNKSFLLASKVRRSARKIQRAWINKFKARLCMLEYLGRNHVKAMIKQFPHFKNLEAQFNFNKCNRQICLQYMKDQSQKFRLIYQLYRHRVEQIKEFTQQNLKIQQFNEKNKDNPKFKPKQKLYIPKQPIKPQHRFFRNLDILKSMLRAWFELNYKQWLKRNKPKK